MTSAAVHSTVSVDAARNTRRARRRAVPVSVKAMSAEVSGIPCSIAPGLRLASGTTRASVIQNVTDGRS
jgi:hypothetical protein